MALKAGNIVENTITGEITENLAGSMALAIETAFKTEWKKINKKDPPPGFNEQTRLLFFAVAQGVVNHIKNNPLSITINLNSGTTQTGTLTINS